MNETMLSKSTQDVEPDGKVELVGMVVEISPRDKNHRLPIDSKKWRFVLLGTKEQEYIGKDGKLRMYEAKRWGIIIPPGREKEFLEICGGKWELPDELVEAVVPIK